VFVNENLLYLESPAEAELLDTFVAVAHCWDATVPSIPFEPADPTFVNAVAVPVTPGVTTALTPLAVLKSQQLKSAALAD
jgi:hypothetical protein